MWYISYLLNLKSKNYNLYVQYRHKYIHFLNLDLTMTAGKQNRENKGSKTETDATPHGDGDPKLSLSPLTLPRVQVIPPEHVYLVQKLRLLRDPWVVDPV